MANSAPAEQVIAQVTSGDRWATLASAPLVWETLLMGSGTVSELVSEGSSGVVGGLPGEMTDAGGSIFAGVSGVLVSGVAVARGAVGIRLEAVVSGSGSPLGTATLQLWM